MESRHFIPPTDNVLSPEDLDMWCNFFREHPWEAERLTGRINFLKRMSLLSIIDKEYKYEEMIYPKTVEEAKMLSTKWVGKFVEAPVGYEYTYFNELDKFEIYPELQLTEDQIETVAAQLRNVTETGGNNTWNSDEGSLRKFSFKHKNSGVESNTELVLPLLKDEHIEGLLEKRNTRLYQFIIEQRPHFWGKIASEGPTYTLAIGPEDIVMEMVRHDPSLGQLAIGNPRFTDKAELVKLWLTKYKYLDIKWEKRARPYTGIFNPKESICDVRGLPDKFFTKRRLLSLYRMLRVYKRVTLIGSAKVVRWLREQGIDRAFKSWESMRRMNTPYKEMRDGTGNIIRTSTGLH